MGVTAKELTLSRKTGLAWLTTHWPVVALAVMSMPLLPSNRYNQPDRSAQIALICTGPRMLAMLFTVKSTTASSCPVSELTVWTVRLASSQYSRSTPLLAMDVGKPLRAMLRDGFTA